VVLDQVVRQKPDTIRAHFTVTVEIEGGDKPACVASAIAVYIVAV
jgi:hypothetical protein